MARKSKQNYKQEYQKQIKRIKQIIYREKKKGVVFNDDILATLKEEKITSSTIRSLESITPESIRQRGVYIMEDTGEIVPASFVKRSHKGVPYIPTLGAIESVKNNLINLSRKVYPKFDIESRKNTLLSIFDDTLSQYELYEEQRAELLAEGKTNEAQALPTIIDFENYLVQKFDELNLNITTITYDSNQEHVNASFVQLAVILNQGSLTPLQSEGISNMQEYYASGDDYES